MDLFDQIIHRRLGMAIRRGFSAILLITLVAPFLQCSSTADFSVMEKSEVDVIKLETKSKDVKLDRIDAFVFNKSSGKLDVFQRIEAPIGQSLSISSTTGRRIIYLLANVAWRDYKWSEVGSVALFEDLLLSLENDSLDKPIMTARCETDGESGKCTAELKPVSTKIVLNSLVCDFKGTAYEGQSLKDLRVYLCNVNADKRIGENADQAYRYVNQGELRVDDMKNFNSPEILCQSPGTTVGAKGIKPGLCFLCYPNPIKEEGIAGNFTRLVIEGNIDGQRWYYPINLPRGAAIKAGSTCVYDVVLRRKGCTDPDIAVELNEIESSFRICEWDAKDEYVADF